MNLEEGESGQTRGNCLLCCYVFVSLVVMLISGSFNREPMVVLLFFVFFLLPECEVKSKGEKFAELPMEISGPNRKQLSTRSAPIGGKEPAYLFFLEFWSFYSDSSTFYSLYCFLCLFSISVSTFFSALCFPQRTDCEDTPFNHSPLPPPPTLILFFRLINSNISVFVLLSSRRPPRVTDRQGLVLPPAGGGGKKWRSVRPVGGGHQSGGLISLKHL